MPWQVHPEPLLPWPQRFQHLQARAAVLGQTQPTLGHPPPSWQLLHRCHPNRPGQWLQDMNPKGYKIFVGDLPLGTTPNDTEQRLWNTLLGKGEERLFAQVKGCRPTR